MEKQTLRNQYKAQRNSLTAEELQQLDLALLQQLQAYDWSALPTLHVYLPIEKFKEYNTWPFIKWLWQQYPELTLLCSVSDFQSHQLRHYKLKVDGQLQENAWGIPEPVGAEEVEVLEIDAVLAPLLVVDRQGNRVGYGKGFYDRFFASCRPDVKRLGLSYFEPVENITDVHGLDVPIQVLFTPGKTFYF